MLNWKILWPLPFGIRNSVDLVILVRTHDKVVISICLSDHNSGTSRPICPKIRLGNSGESRKFSKIGSKLSSLSWKLAKTVFYDKARVNGWTNYGQRWVSSSHPSYLKFSRDKTLLTESCLIVIKKRISMIKFTKFLIS